MLFVFKLLLIFFGFIFSCFMIKFLIKMYYVCYDWKHNIKVASVIPLKKASVTELSINSYVIELTTEYPEVIDYGIYG